jgi:hypothetical protein
MRNPATAHPQIVTDSRLHRAQITVEYLAGFGDMMPFDRPGAVGNRRAAATLPRPQTPCFEQFRDRGMIYWHPPTREVAIPGWAACMNNP